MFVMLWFWFWFVTNHIGRTKQKKLSLVQLSLPLCTGAAQFPILGNQQGRCDEKTSAKVDRTKSCTDLVAMPGRERKPSTSFV
jgi:hypothetical protein